LQGSVITGLFDAGDAEPPDGAERGSNGDGLSGFDTQIISSAREGIVILDRDLRFRLWNPFMEEVSGLSWAVVFGKHYSELFPFVNEQGHGAFLDRALEGESLASLDILYQVPASGKSGWASASYDPLRNHAGEIVGVLIFVQEITSRKLNEEALRESEQRLQLAVRGSNVGLWDWDMRTQTVYYSPEWKSQLGFDDDEVGDGFDEWESRLHPDDHDATCAMVQSYLEQPWPDYESEFRLRHKDGSYRWILARASVRIGADGRPERMLGCHVDLTDRRQAEEALRKSEEKHRELVENINEIVYATDEHGIITYISPVVELVMGCQPSEIVGEAFVEFIHPEDLPMLLESYRRTMAGAIEPLEYRVFAKSGDVRWVRSSSRPVFEGGRVVGLRGVIADITTHKHVEAHLELLATAVEQAAESIVITDVDGTIQYVNPAFERTTGYSRDEVIGQNPRILKSKLQDTSYYREMWSMISRGEVWTGRFINKRKNETLFEEEATISPVRDGSGRIVNFVAVKRDVTKEVELEKQLLHAQKMEAVGRLAGGIAHDFNNLLTAIIGYSQILEARLGENHGLRLDVAQVLDAGQRAAVLTSQLLAFSRRQTLQTRLISLNDTIGKLMKMLRRIIGEDIDLRFHASSNPDQVFADAGQIDQVVMNLAVNARDAMLGGGRLIIETRNVTLDEAYCREHLWAKPGEYVQILVSDSGAGMDAETQRRMFEPFFTTKEVGKGTGLGLAVVYGIVQQHDGLIHAYSEPGHGTTFKIYLKAAGEGSRDQLEQPAEPVRGGNETILVAEDEETLRVLARSILENLGYRVILASDGEEAVRLFQAANGEIDLLIFDLIMPRMGGHEAFERIRELGKPVPVIYVTGYAHGLTPGEAKQHGLGSLIEKPYAIDQLGRIVRKLLDGLHQTEPQGSNLVEPA
jgi:PAS domain S-box-containing protein